jgi:hypothetical protein
MQRSNGAKALGIYRSLGCRGFTIETMEQIKDGYETFVKELPAVMQRYPSLKICANDTHEFLQGSLDVIDFKKVFWESYDIEIHYRHGYPQRYPVLFETGGKIPKISDWHVFEDTYACCVNVEPAEIIRCVNGITLNEYIQEEVIPYLFNQTHRRVEGFYVNGEYDHGAAGLYQFYSKVLCTEGDIEKTIRLMLAVAHDLRPSDTYRCICGSNKRFIDCHENAYGTLQRMGTRRLEIDAYAIIKAAKIQSVRLQRLFRFVGREF